MNLEIFDELSKYMHIDKDTLIKEGIQSFLKEKKSRILLDRIRILSNYKVASKGELEKKLKKGEVEEHPTWEDLILVENLEKEIEKIDEYLRTIKESAQKVL